MSDTATGPRFLEHLLPINGRSQLVDDTTTFHGGLASKKKRKDV